MWRALGSKPTRASLGDGSGWAALSDLPRARTLVQKATVPPTVPGVVRRLASCFIDYFLRVEPAYARAASHVAGPYMLHLGLLVAQCSQTYSKTNSNPPNLFTNSLKTRVVFSNSLYPLPPLSRSSSRVSQVLVLQIVCDPIIGRVPAYLTRDTFFEKRLTQQGCKPRKRRSCAGTHI